MRREVVTTIENERPAVVFAPHVETSSGMILPDDYLTALAAAAPGAAPATPEPATPATGDEAAGQDPTSEPAAQTASIAP